MKNVSRNKFLLCFRPVVDMDIMLESKGVLDGSAGQGLQYVSVENKDQETKETKALMTPKRSFSRVVKAVMFDTILTKRVRDRKDSYLSKRSLSTNSDKLVNRASVDGNIEEMKTSSGLLKSSSFGSYWSSNCPSSISESKNLSRSLSDDITKQNHDMNHEELVVKPKKVDLGWSGFNSGIYLFVISLIITILWGRICAILFTSIWVYFVSRRHVGYDRQVSVIKSAKAESRHDKKRVIMEGLLERNHLRGH